MYTPPGKAEQGNFSLECAKKSLDFYDDFFAIPYPLPKLDMVAIPEFAMVSTGSLRFVCDCGFGLQPPYKYLSRILSLEISNSPLRALWRIGAWSPTGRWTC